MENVSVSPKNCVVCKSDIASEKEGVNCPKCQDSWHGKCQPKDNKCPSCKAAVKPVMGPLFAILMVVFSLLTATRMGVSAFKEVGSVSEFIYIVLGVIGVIILIGAVSVLYGKLFGKEAGKK